MAHQENIRLTKKAINYLFKASFFWSYHAMIIHCIQYNYLPAEIFEFSEFATVYYIYIFYAKYLLLQTTIILYYECSGNFPKTTYFYGGIDKMQFIYTIPLTVYFDEKKKLMYKLKKNAGISMNKRTG